MGEGLCTVPDRNHRSMDFTPPFSGQQRPHRQGSPSWVQTLTRVNLCYPQRKPQKQVSGVKGVDTVLPHLTVTGGITGGRDSKL